MTPEHVYITTSEQFGGLCVQLLQNIDYVFLQFKTQTNHFVLVQQITMLLYYTQIENREVSAVVTAWVLCEISTHKGCHSHLGKDAGSRAHQAPGLVTSFIWTKQPEMVLEVQGACWGGIRGDGWRRGYYHSSYGIKEETLKWEWCSQLYFTFHSYFYLAVQKCARELDFLVYLSSLGPLFESMLFFVRCNFSLGKGSRCSSQGMSLLADSW